MREETKRRYESQNFRREKLIAAAWLFVFAVAVGGSIYGKIGRPAIEAMTPAVADVAPERR